MRRYIQTFRNAGDQEINQWLSEHPSAIIDQVLRHSTGKGGDVLTILYHYEAK